MIGLGGLLQTLIVNRQRKKAQIEIKKAAADIEFEIKYKYVKTEIQTRNLLEIYPKLYKAMLEAVSPYTGYFSTIIDKLIEAQKAGQVVEFIHFKDLIENYYEPCFGEYDSVVKKLGFYSNYLTTSALFVSSIVMDLATEIKKDSRVLYRFIEDHVRSRKYLKYDAQKLLTLFDEVSLQLASIEHNRTDLIKQMSKELNPDC